MSIILLTVGVYNYSQLFELKNKIASDLALSVSSKVIEKSLNFFKDIEDKTNLASKTLNYTEIKRNRDNWISYFWEVTSKNSYITSMYIADSKDNFFQVRNYPKRAVREIIDKNESWYIKAIDYSTIEEYSKKTAFFPTTRPWFQLALDSALPIWSNLYIFESTKSLGVTLSNRVNSKKDKFLGVVATDVSLDILTDFIKSIKVECESSIFIFNEKNEIIASDRVKADNKILTFADINDSLMSESIKLISSSGKNIEIFNVNNKNYIHYIVDFPKDFSRSWKLAIILNEDELLADIHSIMIRDFMISLSILIAGFLSINIISARISSPVKLLSNTMESIKNLDLDVDLRVDSLITEVRTMQESVFSMHSGLKSFQMYIPSDLVKDLIQEGKVATIGGEKRYLTVMFTDIESFTTLSEYMDSKDLMIHISEYLDEMSKIIKLYNGTIDKYIGDSIMAFWNAPREIDKHEELACECALVIQSKLKELNLKWESEGKPILKTRIGINSSYVVVGNVGSHYRINYTILGDGVNTTSRLEALNKVYKTEILVSEFTYEVVKEKFNFRFLDSVVVKGKSNSIKVYELLSC